MKQLFAAMTLIFPIVSHAGVLNGGGGKGIVCRDNAGKTMSVELLDLWEERTIRGQTQLPSTGNVAQDVAQALAKLKFVSQSRISIYDGTQVRCRENDCVASEMQKTADAFLNKSPKVVRLRGVKLIDTKDAMEIAVPADCAVEQIVNYQPEGGSIVVNEDLYEKMDVLNQAALIVHESLYSYLRHWGNELNSIRVRRAVGAAFSRQNAFQQPADLYKTAEYIECLSDKVDEHRRPLTALVFSPDLRKVNIARLQGQVPLAIESDDSILVGGQPLLKMILETGTCNYEGADGGYKTRLDGVVEFDRAFDIFQTCSGGFKHPQISLRAPGESNYEQYLMTCQTKKKPVSVQ